MPHTWSSNLPFRALLGLLFWAPLPFGSNRPWAAALLCLGVFLLLLLVLLASAWQRRPLVVQESRGFIWPLLLLLAVQAWVAFQLLPLPRDWLHVLSPRAALLHLPAEAAPLTLDHAMTRYNLMLGTCYTSLFFLVVALVNTRARIIALLWTLTLAGALQALYGSMMTLSGLEYGFFVEKYVGQGVATGTFVNRNHFAGYLVLALASGVGLLVSRLDVDSGTTGKQRLRSWVATLLSTKLLLRLLLAVMVVALVLSRSRMGNLAFFSALTLAGGMALLFARRGLNRRVLWLFASLLLVDLVIVGQWFGAEEVAQRLAQTSRASEQRDDVAAVTLDMIRDYPWTGSGAGSYYTVFPHYSNFVPEDDYYTHAHNDYLELAATLGLPATALLGLFVLATLFMGIRLISQGDSRLQHGVGCCVVMTTIWILLHSSADFNTQIPANAASSIALCALAWQKTFTKGEKRN